jgi:hypothetical protein
MRGYGTYKVLWDHFNIALPSAVGLSSRLFPSGFSTFRFRISYHSLACSSHIILFYCNIIKFCDTCEICSCLLHSYSRLPSFRLPGSKYSHKHRVMKHSFHPLNVSHQVPYAYTTSSMIICLYRVSQQEHKI